MKQLFIDDYIIEEIDNLIRKLHQPQKFKGNAVLRPERRWENAGIQVRQAPVWVPEESIFKWLYMGSSTPLGSERRLDPGDGFPSIRHICYATSTDGVNWEKPVVGLCDYGGVARDSKQNNIIPAGEGVLLLLAPLHDPAEPDPERRYKGLAFWRGPGLSPAVSPDCLRWSYLDVPVISSQDEAEVTHDVDKGLFILTLKHQGPYGRSVYLTTSEDFEHWSEQELVFYADERDQGNGKERLAKFFEHPDYLAPVCNRPEEYRTDVYHMGVFPYEGLYLGLPVMFHWSSAVPSDGRKSVELTSSRDLRHWNRVADRAPFLELSPVGRGAYDLAQIQPANRPIVRNNELWFYYAGLKYRALSNANMANKVYLDGSAVCMARLRMDGFVSLHGGIEWGSVLTKPIAIEGKELHINVDSWRGQVKVEILDASDGQPIPGFSQDESVPAVIDSIDETMQWQDQSDLGNLLGKTVRIRFNLLRAELYAFWFAG
jgi:hypothetical protein